MQTIRVLVVVAAKQKVHFQSSSWMINKETFMLQVQASKCSTKKEKDLLCSLNKSIYGLKQAGMSWHKTLTGHLNAHGFARLEKD
jgi:hypothetical protein